MKNIVKIIIFLFIIVILVVLGYFLFARESSDKNVLNSNSSSNKSISSSSSLHPLSGCGNVSPPGWQTCCDKWAEDFKVQGRPCVGSWIVKEDVCTWICSNQVSNNTGIPVDRCGLDNNGNQVCS